MPQLPQEFTRRMALLLGEEYEAFLASYGDTRVQGLRRNPLKISREEWEGRSQAFGCTPVPWAEEGYYYDPDTRPGKHPWHEAGLYYIQEPSAMAVAALADPQPGEWVLDLCAAPGGKSTHLAGRMAGHGLLVANEIHPARAKILSQNIERMGIANALVTNESPRRLADWLGGVFDRVVVDAPCSGEGMFRKDPQAADHWSEENVALCAQRQEEILDAAADLLRPGGRLVYSTCTFAPEEDENSIGAFLQRHPDFWVEELPGAVWFAPGTPQWSEQKLPALAHTFRLWPHKLRGEGHYIAVLRRAGSLLPHPAAEPKMPQPAEGLLGGLWAFLQETAVTLPQGQLHLFGENLYLLPPGTPNLAGYKVLRPGLQLGVIKKNRFEPAHALALALSPAQVGRVCPLTTEEALPYLRGEALMREGEKGWTLVTVDGHSLGWGKQADGMLKNHYPKGLRWPFASGR